MLLEIIITLTLYGLAIFYGEAASMIISPFYSRKISHILCAIITALLPLYLDLNEAIYCLIALILLAASTKVLNTFKRIELSDKKNLGTIYFPAGGLLTALLFWNVDTKIFMGSILVLGFADSLAAIFGKRYGKLNIISGTKKTYVGSITFFLVTLIIFSFFYALSINLENILIIKLILIVLASMVVTVVEFLSPKATDNILIPLSSGIVLYMLL